MADIGSQKKTTGIGQDCQAVDSVDSSLISYNDNSNKQAHSSLGKTQGDELAGKSGKVVSLKNKWTGQVFEFLTDPGSRSLFLFKAVCRGLDRMAQVLGWRVYFLTLTLRDDESLSVNRELNRFLSFLRMRFKRAGVRLIYAWVVELQKKRYLKYGVMCLHWHFVIVAPAGSLPDVRFLPDARRHYQVITDGSLITAVELFKRWGRGQVLCGYAWSGVQKYLGKYFTKDYESLADYKVEWSKLRRFGASQLGLARYPEWAYNELMSLRDDGLNLDSLKIVKTGGKVRLYDIRVDSQWSDGRGDYLRYAGHKHFKLDLGAPYLVKVLEIKSPWECSTDWLSEWLRGQAPQEVDYG
ncbi:hypothetical protein ES705_42810 [subsurface metagenome]